MHLLFLCLTAVLATDLYSNRVSSSSESFDALNNQRFQLLAAFRQVQTVMDKLNVKSLHTLRDTEVVDDWIDVKLSVQKVLDFETEGEQYEDSMRQAHQKIETFLRRTEPLLESRTASNVRSVGS